jgi:hypothetical protein
MWKPRRLTTLWAFTVSYRESFTLLPIFTIPRVSINHIEKTVLDGPSPAAAPFLDAHVTPQESLKYHNGPSVAPVEQGRYYYNGQVTFLQSKLKSRLSVSFSSALYFLTLTGLVSRVLLKRITKCNRDIPKSSLSPCIFPSHRAASLLPSIMQLSDTFIST